MPSRSATSCASSMLTWPVNGDGSRTPSTRSGPSASTPTAALSAESTPPESPSTIPGNPFLST